MKISTRIFAAPLAVLALTALFACSANSPPDTNSNTTTPAAVDKPIAVLVIDPLTLKEGGTTVASWSTEDATACTATGAWGGSVPLDNSVTIGPITQPGTYTYGVTCTGPGGSVSTSQTITVGAVPAPVLTLDIYPASIQPGDSALLVWSTANATSCTGSAGTGSDGWQGPQSVNSDAGFNTGPITTIGQYQYNLTCIGPGGSTQQTRILSVATTSPVTPPSVTFASSPAVIQLNQTSNFTWSSTNATACTASGGNGSDGWSGTKPTSSTGTVIGPTTTLGVYSYTLTCTGAGGSAAKTLTLIVGALPPLVTVVVDATPAVVVAGNAAALTWTSQNADSCVASGSWSGAQPVLGSNVSTGTLSTPGLYTYALTCTGASGSALGSATVLVTPAAPIVTILSATPTTVLNGGSTSLRWVAIGATACTASGGSGADGWSGSVPIISTGFAVGPIPTGTYTYTLICSGLGGTGAPQSVNVTAQSSNQPPASVTSFFITPSSTLQVLQAATLTWTSSGADSCTATGGTGTDGWNGSVGTASSGTSTGLILFPGTYTYTLTCTGAGGTGAPSTVVLNVLPLIPLTATVTAFNASPTNIQTGQSSSLSWSSVNATSCAATGGTGADGWTGSVGTSSLGFNTGAILTAGTYTYTLTCSGTGGAGTPSQVVINVSSAPPPAAAIVSFSAFPSIVITGLSTSLSWQTTSAATCTATGGTGTDAWTGVVATSNTGMVIGPLTNPGNYIYTLTCTGPGGTSVPSSISVDVIGAPLLPNIGVFAALPATVTTGGSTTLTWTVLNATACTASGGTGADGWSGSVGTIGVAKTVGPISPAGTYNYTLTCTGPGGSTTNTVTVNAADAPLPATLIAFLATPTSLQTGQSTLLTWASVMSTSCTGGGGTGSDGWVGSKSSNGIGTSIGPFTTPGVFAYTLSCDGSGGTSQTLTQTVTVTSAPPPATIVSLVATPSTVITGQSVLLTWVTSGASACTASGGTGSDGWAGTEPTSSLVTLAGPINNPGTYVYTLNCTGPGGASAPMSTSVNVVSATPAATIVSFTAVPSVVTVGQISALSWISTSASSCTASGGTGSDSWPGTVGTLSLGTIQGPYAAAGTYTYSLVCTGTGGASSASTVTVTVNPAAVGQPTVSLNINGSNPGQVQPGTPFTLSWASTNATACTASGGTGSDGWNGSKPINSSGVTIASISTPGIYAYTLTCSGAGGTGGGTVLVTVIASTAVDCGIPGVPTTTLFAPAASVGDTVDGICLGCGVSGLGNVILASTTSPSVMVTGVGLLGGGVTLAVTENGTTFPAGRQAGFMISDGASLLSLSLLNNVNLVTYLHGTVQETASTANNLIKLQALGLLSVNSNAGFAGFTTSKPFDEVSISVQQVAGLLSSVNVYRACVSLK
jgi:hypothetical protein